MTVHSSQYVKCFINRWRSGSWSLRSFLMLVLSRGCNSLTFALVGPGGLAAKAPGGEVEGGVWRCCLDAEEEALWTFCQLRTGSSEKPALEAAACAGEPPLVLCWSASQQNKRLTPGTVSSFSSFLMEALCGGRLFSCRGEVKWCGEIPSWSRNGQVLVLQFFYLFYPQVPHNLMKPKTWWLHNKNEEFRPKVLCKMQRLNMIWSLLFSNVFSLLFFAVTWAQYSDFPKWIWNAD